MKINKIIIWGHELHDHTHSYIHNAFFKAFKYMGYDTYWLNNCLENIEKINTDNSLFIVHGIVSNFLPINNNSIYIMHNVLLVKNKNGLLVPKNYFKEMDKGIPRENIIALQVYTNNCLKNRSKEKYYFYDIPPHPIIYFPWATDLLPHEIDENIKNLDNLPKTNKLNFIGMPIPPWNKVTEYCKKKGILYKHYGGTFNKESKLNMSIEENMKLIQESIIAPAVQCEWQVKNHYIPCRIFKNISYGKMGVTNNKGVNNLFNNKLIYSENIEELMEKAYDFEINNKDKNKIVKELMEEVRDKHTYINRCNYIIDYLKEYFNIEFIQV